MNQTNRWLLITCTFIPLTLLPVANVTAQSGFTTETVRSIVKSIEGSLNERDWQANGSLFSEQGDMILFDSRRAVGPAGVEALMREEWAETPADVTAKLTPTSIRFPNRELAIVTVEGEFVGSNGTNRDRAIFVIANSGSGAKIEALRVFDAEEK